MFRTVDRLFILNAGLAIASDRSIYTPGKWEGEQFALSCNAYLISRGNEWLLWDTGIPDEIAAIPGGRVLAHNLRGLVTRTIRSQFEDIGISTADVSRVILSHAHFDHVGNAALFPNATWFIQRREREAMFSSDYERHGYDRLLYECLLKANLVLMDGDYDLFEDSSVRVLSTPGHTPGHCSLSVRLRNTGTVVLSGDVAHYKYNMEHRQVPAFNFDASSSIASMEKIEALIREDHAHLWINHDIVQSETLKHAPAYFD